MKLLAAFACSVLLALPSAGRAQWAAQPQEEQGSGQAQGSEDSDRLLAAFRTAVADMRRQMFTAGPAVAGWNEGGGDPDAAVRAAGAEDHVLLLTGGEGGPSVVMLTARPITAVAPPEWRIADSYGSSGIRLANPFVQFTRLSPRYVLAVRASSRRSGTADCADPVANAILYEAPDAPESADDESIPIFFRIALLAAEEQTTCTRYDPVGSGWRPVSFLPDGHALPQLDSADQRVRVVPLAPLEQLLAPAPEAAPSA